MPTREDSWTGVRTEGTGEEDRNYGNGLVVGVRVGFRTKSPTGEKFRRDPWNRL